MDFVEFVAVVIGTALAAVVLMSAVRTVVVPRGDPRFLARLTFFAVRRIFDVVARIVPSHDVRERLYTQSAPVALVTLPFVWGAGFVYGFSLVFWGLGVTPYRDALVLSGSSVTTLGFEGGDTLPVQLYAIAESMMGLVLIALVIGFLPTIYGKYSGRELSVEKIYTRATDVEGVPGPATMIVRAHLVGGLDQLPEVWDEWENWFVDLHESHASYPALNFFRSAHRDRSWVTAAGLALDASALYTSTIDVPRHPKASLMIRSGFIGLRGVADFFGVAYDPDPHPDDPISIDRAEFDAVYRAMGDAGVPLRADIDHAWQDFAGWRVNYDAALLGLAAVTDSPPMPWWEATYPDVRLRLFRVPPSSLIRLRR